MLLPLVLASLAVVALVSIVLFARSRRIEAARERAWIGTFSFGDVVARMRDREARRVARPA